MILRIFLVIFILWLELISDVAFFLLQEQDPGSWVLQPARQQVPGGSFHYARLTGKHLSWN